MHLCLIVAENAKFQTFQENSYHFEPQSLISDQSLQNKTKVAPLCTQTNPLVLTLCAYVCKLKCSGTSNMAHAIYPLIICNSRFPFNFFERKGPYNFLQQTLIKQ